MPETVAVVIPEPNIRAFKVTLKGTAPLIQHKWSEKAKKQIRDKQQKKASKARGKRDPKAEYEAAKIKTEKGKLAIKAIWIKKAVVAAARNIDGVPMTILRGAVFVRGDEDGLIPLKYKKERMIEDVVRLSGGTSDLRYRPYIHGWEADVTIEHNADVLSTEQVVNLLKIAGFACGIGERRPGKSGEDFGTFDVLTVNLGKPKK